MNFSMRTGGTKALTYLAAHDCSTCAAIVNRVQNVYVNGGHLDGDGWAVRTISYIPGKPRGQALVSVGIDIAPQDAYEEAGSSPSHSPASRGSLDFHLERDGSSWKVVRLDATQ